MKKEQVLPLWKLEPTAFHRKVADQVVRDYLPGICLSLNYDGLTAKAIKEVACKRDNSKNPKKENLEPLYPCRILTTQEEIRQYYARNSKAGDFYPIIKLKGDIFNAICGTEGCRHYNQLVPIYEIGLTGNKINNKASNDEEAENQFSLPFSHEQPSILPQEPDRKGSENQSPPLTNPKYEEVMKCRGCGEIRRVEIEFPGYRTKELETNKVIEMIYRLVVPSLSCVVVCGVSGNWDHEIIEFLRVCAIERGLKIYCLDIENPPLLQYHVPWAISKINDNDKSNFFPIEIDFSEFDKKN